ncbi:MAG: zinc ABC transporter substrate-binding protein [Verrucomicrobiota bacterium]
MKTKTIDDRRLKTILLGFLSAAFIAVALSGCGQQPAASADAEPKQLDVKEGEKINIVTTTGMVRDIVANVAGERAEVSNLMGEGVDPHLYKPTRDDVVKLSGADVIFYSGLQLEGRMSDTFDALEQKGMPVYAVTELIQDDFLLEEDEDHHHGEEEEAGEEAHDEPHSDPHVWMDVSAWSKGVDVVTNALAELDPAGAETYRANAAAYQSELADLHKYGQDSLATVPEEKRYLITAHDAFNYFSRAYDIDVVGVQGLSTESEAGVQDINRLVDLIVSKKIPAIFVETSVSDKNVRAIIEGAKDKGWDVVIGGELYSDAMGEPGTYPGTYAGMMDHNITTITRALGGEAPAAGKNGQLEKE